MANRKKAPELKLAKKVQVQVTESEYERIESLINEEMDSVSKVGRSLILAALGNMVATADLRVGPHRSAGDGLPPRPARFAAADEYARRRMAEDKATKQRKEGAA